jgi:hypothetical protein
MFGLIERYLYRNSDKIITLLPNSAEHMILKGARSNDNTWIPNGVDLEMMPLPELCPRIRCSQYCTHALMV